MSTRAAYLRRDPAEVTPWAETCGQIRCLVEEKDGAAAEVHHVEIHDAKLHYHARTDEFYYIIDGQGTMILDDETIEVHKGRGRIRAPRRQAQGHRQLDRAYGVHPARRPVGRSRAGIKKGVGFACSAARVCAVFASADLIFSPICPGN